METSEREYSHVYGDYGVREATEAERAEYGDPYRYWSYLCRVSTGEVLGEDGGEPEDQTLGRDWKWVPALLASEVEQLTRERDEARDAASNHANRSEESRAYAAEQRDYRIVAERERDEARSERDDLLDPEDTIGRIWQERAEKAEADVGRLMRERDEALASSRLALGADLRDARKERDEARAEVERLRRLLYSYAEHAHDSGWTNLASEIRRVAEAD